MKVISNIYRSRRYIGTLVWDDEPAVQFPPFKEDAAEDRDMEMKTVEYHGSYRIQ
ncbi:MAG TPA: hypothetical protein VGH22_15435 [Candidatus Binatia bacterium]|jgi:hypothetical protein